MWQRNLLSRTKLILPIAFLLLLIQPAQATHLVGGNITYTYKGEQDGLEVYDILVSMYRDCTSKTPFDNTIEIGFYEAKGLNPPKYTSLFLPILSIKRVNPPAGGSQCDYQPNVCLEEGLYQGEIRLPASTYGYHMEHLRCCRNTMNNVPDNTGYTYYGYISPSYLHNSSPTFDAVPAPYVCVNDTIRMVNSAQEADGDSLVYKLTVPYTGGDKNTPAPGPPSNFVVPDPVSYNSGYSYKQPFGAKGYIKVDSISGITTVYVPNAGRYVYAIEVDEYRNGILIGATRRDIQLIGENCPPNPPPARIAVNNSLQSVFSVTAGEEFQYQFSYYDADSLTLAATGDILNPNRTKPNMILTTSSTDGKTIKGTMVWRTSCRQSRSTPYTLTVSVTDKGCPPKTRTDIYTIYVRPFKGADKINGPTEVCWGDQPTTYTAITKGGGTLQWSITNGTLETDTGSMVKAHWSTGSTSGIISVVEVSKNGCPGDTVKKTVHIEAPPKTSPIAGSDQICFGDTADYMVISTTGSSYRWSVYNGQVVSTNNNQVRVAWNKPDSGMVSVVETNSRGCLGDTMRLPIFISTTKADSIYGSASVCPNSSGIDYWVTSQKGSSYYWSVQGGKQVSGGNGSHITVDWGEKGGGIVKVIEVTKLGCSGDTITLPVLKDYVLYTSPIQGDSFLCEFTKGVPYSVVYSHGSVYAWKVGGGTIVSGNGSSRVIVDWDTAGIGVISVTETAWDPVNNKPCVGKPVAKVIRKNPLPDTKGIYGPASVCAMDTNQIYSVQGFDSSQYIWKLNNLDSFAGNNLSNTVHLHLDTPGVYMLQVYEITNDSCVGKALAKSISVHPLPKTGPIQGPNIVCLPHLNGHHYHVDGYASSHFDWNIDGGQIVSGQGSPDVTVNWQQEGHRSISVLETTEFGCKKDSQKLEVLVDSLNLEITLVTTSLDNDKQLELHWIKKNGQFLHKDIKIYRSQDGMASDFFDLIDSVPNTQTMYIDTKVHTERYAYRYRISAPNSCGYEIVSAPHKSILLRGNSPNDSTVSLVWNKYQGWPTGVDHYNLFRDLNEKDAYNLFHTTGSTDTVWQFTVGLDGFEQCFRVGAVKSQDTLVSWSNKLCFDFDPYLYIPNAFTPDANGTNDLFKVYVSNFKSYDITIFNRWGERIFQSTDPSVMWDGTFHGGQCPQDVYLYVIHVGGSKQNLYRKGTISLLR